MTRNGVDLYEQGRNMLDVNASQRLLRGVKVKASVKNVLNNEHREFVGAPEIGRLGLARLTYML